MTQTGDIFTYYIVFQDSDTIPRPWKWFTRKGFRHCSVFMACEGGTINLNQSLYGIKVYSYYAPLEIVINSLCEKNIKVLKLIKKDESFYGNKLGTFFPSCVSLCQRITGLTFHAFTPYSYYRKLLQNGAILIKENDMGGKPKVDQSLMRQQQKEMEDAKKREEEERARQEDLRQRQRLGRRSLLGTEGDELGVM
jgi:hypothetical protein